MANHTKKTASEDSDRTEVASEITPETSRDTGNEEQHAAPAPIPRLSVVGIGASAGGLAPLRTFFSSLPADTGLTFVVVTHLSPQHESVLAELLQPHTTMPVQQVTERVDMQPNHVYVIPPAKRLLVMEGHLDLAEFDMPRGRRLQIDTFFRSLAAHHGDGGAVVLSGSGSDGAVGIQHIKEHGGLILVQDPAEAEYDGMPLSAITTGLADVVAPVAELADHLVKSKRVGAKLELPADPANLSAAIEEVLVQLLTHLRVRTGHDFSGYKRATILRRIGRRMQIVQLPSLVAYLHRLRHDAEEVDALYRDILIHVTEFFRDTETWAFLTEQVIPQLFANKDQTESIRVWTVGCATGEEAYSVAMLLLEHAATLPRAPKIQIFASDLGELVLEFARQGIYPQAIAAQVSPERLSRFFTQENSHYRVREELRETVLFTPHNLLQDPPFSKLDLILCRNLLIYLQRPQQVSAFEIFHYALHQNGYLLLGSAESAESISTLFEAVDKQHRVYRRSSQSSGMLVLPSLPIPSEATRLATRAALMQGNKQQVEARPPWLLETVAPPSLLIDQQHNVLQLSATAGRYLQHPAGSLTAEVLRLVRPELQNDLRSALVQAAESGRSVLSRAVPVQFNGAAHPVALLVRPIQRDLTKESHTEEPATATPHHQFDQALIFFLEGEVPLVGGIEQSGAGVVLEVESRQQMQTELNSAHRQLQALREEHETTVEELRAANEELQSTNEEYRSTLEELETSKEELQSINEELQTVNLELRGKVEETSQAHNDLQNLFTATEIATLFLDRELKIKRYTPHAAELFNLMPPDQGRPIDHLRNNLVYPTLEADARRVLKRLAPVEREVQGVDEQWYQVNVRPYRTQNDYIEGVVITFVDITLNKRHEQELREAKEYAESIIHTIPNALLVLSPDLRVQLANDAFYEIFQVSRSDTEGQLIYELGSGQWNIDQLRTLLEDVLPENQTFTAYEVSHNFEDIGQRTMLLNGRRLEALQLILLSITDITDRKQAEEELRASEERYRLLVESAQEYAIFMLDVAGRIATWNTGAERLFGYTEEEVVGQEVALLFTPEDRAAGIPEAEMETALCTGRANDDRWQLCKDGSRFWASGAMEPLHHTDGDLGGFVKVLRNNSEQKAMEEALRESEERYLTSLRNLPAVFAHVDRDLRYEWVLNPHPDFDPTMVVGKRDDEIDSGPGIEALMQFKRDVFASGKQERRELTFELSDEAHIYDMTITPIRDESGEVTRLVTAALDITERRKEQAALRASEERYRTLFESMDEGFCIINMLFDEQGDPVDYRFLTVNPAFTKQTGLHDVVGKRILELVPGHEAYWFATYGKIAVTGEPQRFTEHAQQLDDRWYDVYAFRIGEPAEHKVAVLFNDISERKRVENALEQLTATLEEQVKERTQQVQSLVGQLTLSEQAERQRIAQVLHDDLQQRLYGFQYRLLFLRDAIGEGLDQTTHEQALQLIGEMEQDIKESTELTRNLSSDFSPPVLEGEGLLEAMQWLTAQMENKHGLTVDVQVQDELPTVEPSLRMLLFQTVREILFNVVKHAGVNEATLVLHHNDNQLQIIATDQGDGFDVDQAMGLEQRSHGLWQSQRRLDLIGAQMTIESKPNDGTRITITCPAPR